MHTLSQVRRDKAAEAKRAANKAEAEAETSESARLKDEGNAKYRDGKFSAAIESYTRAIGAAEVPTPTLAPKVPNPSYRL